MLTSTRRGWIKKLFGGFAILAGASTVKASTGPTPPRAWPSAPPDEKPARSVLHIEVGDSEWEPTTEELTSICDAFTFAVEDKGGIIVTRTGVKAKVINIQDLNGVKVVSARVTSKDT